MPSTDITLCVSNVCLKKRDCIQWFGNNLNLSDDREYSHFDPYRAEDSACEYFVKKKENGNGPA